jgi:hypothetical protein
LQQKLYQDQILWQNEHDLFFFSDDNNLSRKETWQGKVESERTVFEAIVSTDYQVSYYKHLAFSVQFKILGGKWYAAIRPDWYFSYDKYKPYFYAADKISWLKRQEKNTNVFNHFRFLAYFLSNAKPLNLFNQKPIYPFLKFGKILEFSNAPALDDKGWELKEETENIPETEQAEEQPTSYQTEMDF